MNQSQFDLWLEFEHWLPQDGDDPEDDCFNMLVTLASGKRYALNVWTFAFTARAEQDCRSSGECLGGAYVLPPDLFVQRLDRALIEHIVADLIATGKLQERWEVHNPLEHL